MLLARVRAAAADAVVLLRDVRELEVQGERAQDARLSLERQRLDSVAELVPLRPLPRRARERTDVLDVGEQRFVLLLDEHAAKQVAEQADVAAYCLHRPSVRTNLPAKPDNRLVRCRSWASLGPWVAHCSRRSGTTTSSRSGEGRPDLLYVDLHLVHEVTSPQAFEGLRLAGRRVRRPDLTVATMDHNVATGDDTPVDPLSQQQLDALARNCEEFGVPLHATGSGREGIVHVIGPELGPDAAGQDDRVRRLAHVDARRVRCARRSASARPRSSTCSRRRRSRSGGRGRCASASRASVRRA